jgi:hypothetical protein
MVAVGEQASLALDVPIDGASDPNREPLYSTGQRPAVVCLRNEVQVVALHGEVHEREAEAPFALCQRLAHRQEQRVPAQGRHATQYTQRDVQRMVRRLRGAGQMRNPRTPVIRRPACPRSDTAPGPVLEAELSR